VERPEPGTAGWLDQDPEPVVEPDLPIVDPHHHLWPPGGTAPYGLAELHADALAGHRVEQTVFVECHAAYRSGGPVELAPVGETEFVAGEAARDPRRLISGIVAHADLRSPHLDAVLDAHEAAGQGLLRGIRDPLAHAREPHESIVGDAPAGLYRDRAFRAGVARLGARGLLYESWHYHYQNRELVELAHAVPSTVMVLDHFGTPLGVGPYAGRRDEIFVQWKADIAELARCDNVVAKLGGLAMPCTGFGWHTAERPPTSDELVAAQARHYLHTIECFGPDRCMFESNFPVDRQSVGYRTLWNAFKKLTTGFSPSERAAMFSGTARRVYRISRENSSSAAMC
jgi:predicted TIM-barrel fold metal-dependent hydrolase